MLCLLGLGVVKTRQFIRSLHVRVFQLVLLGLLFLGCGMADGYSLASKYRHYDANNGEIFIDRIIPYSVSRNLYGISMYIKTLNERLDGDISEVGFRSRCIGDGGRDSEWKNVVFKPHAAASDFWNLYLGLGTIGQPTTLTSYEGGFYVKTEGRHFLLAQRKAGNHARRLSN